MLRWTMIVLGVAVVLLALDRGALWAESRGWLFYRHSPPSRSSAANAMLELQAAFYEPAIEHVVAERKRLDAEVRDDGAPPDP